MSVGVRGAGCVATGSVARTLVEFRWVRELNEGVQRIYDEMASFFSVQLTLENSITSRVLRQHDAMVGDMGQEVYGSLNEYELAAIQYVYGRGRITVKELSDHLQRSAKISRSVLKALVNKGLLVWRGSHSNDPSQHYTLRKS